VIVLDTHAWIWWTTAPAKLSRKARQAIEGADRLGVSPISCLEVATLARRGRIALDRDADAWVEQALAQESIELIPLTPQIAVSAGGLEDGFPGDPADRLIYAAALSAGADLVTKDAALRRFDSSRTIW
jgi:PIN domain nuclease of toxin-antitoxin system